MDPGRPRGYRGRYAVLETSHRRLQSFTWPRNKGAQGQARFQEDQTSREGKSELKREREKEMPGSHGTSHQDRSRGL